MRVTGIVRRVDKLGRVVVPKEIRRTLDMPEGTPVEIFATDEGVYIRRYRANVPPGDVDKLFQ